MFPRLSLAETGWYHSFELPGGRLIEGKVPLRQLHRRWNKLRLEDDLRGKRALDIGTWDGWFAFELERRGADVVALDSAACEGFEVVKDALGSSVEHRLQSVYDLDASEIGHFDIVLFQGVLYHLKHPLLALEKVCAVASDVVLVESFVSAQNERAACLEFYERRELRGQFDNWCGPNVECLLAFCRTAGLVQVNLTDLEGDRALVECRRHWPPLTESPTLPAPLLLAVTSATTNESSLCIHTEDEYAALYFESLEQELTEEDVFPTIGGLGAAMAELRATEKNGWMAVCRVPPGLSVGRTDVYIRTKLTAQSNVLTVPVFGAADTIPRKPETPRPVSVESISIEVVADGKTWERNVLRRRENSLSTWVSGLDDDSIRAQDLHVTVGAEAAEVLFLSGRGPDGRRQINIQVPDNVGLGPTTICVACGGATSPLAPVDVSAEGD